MKEGRVLVVDDEPMVRETLGQVLSDEGYMVDLAVDGETALERVHAARPDAILLDLMMPGMNGRQFLQVLREEPAYASVPVMIMTAVHGLEVNLATMGASEVVEKPFDVDELLNKVALAVYRSRGSSVYATQPLPIVALPPESVPEKERGVVLLVEHDRSRLQQLDMMLGMMHCDPLQLVSFLDTAETGLKLVNTILKEPARTDAEFRKKLTGLLFARAVRVESGSTIRSSDDKEIGRITSATFSPHLGCTVALGYVKYDYLTAGTKVKVISGDSEFTAEVTELPFVRGSWYGDLQQGRA
jgi:CheY-like chemotaxis protein